MSFIKRKYRYKIGKKSSTGFARIYIQNAIDLAAAKFIPDCNFDVLVTAKNITLKVVKNGPRKVIRSKKNASIVELTNKAIDKFCAGAEYVSVTLRKGKIVISLHALEQLKKDRELSLIKMLSEGRITTASLYSGIGALAFQLHKGFSNLGITSEIQYANELDPTAAELNVNFNPIWQSAGKDAVMECDDIQSMDLEELPKDIGLLEIAIPCVGYSRLTKVDNKDISHPLTGKLFIRTIELIRAVNPCTILIECTPGFRGTNTHDCVTDQLEKLGYSHQTIMLKGSEYGDFEYRQRFCLFAVSQGVQDLFPSLHDIKPNAITPKQLSSILEKFRDDDAVWKTYDHIRARDNMTHLGYRNVVLNEDTLHMPALLASYGSPKSGQPFIAHPTDPKLQRMITVREHARIRKLPFKLAEAICMLSDGLLLGRTRTGKTLAHKLLGNAVSPTPWQKVIEHMFSWSKVKKPLIEAIYDKC